MKHEARVFDITFQKKVLNLNHYVNISVSRVIDGELEHAGESDGGKLDKF